jgi:hypothetical protein
MRKIFLSTICAAGFALGPIWAAEVVKEAPPAPLYDERGRAPSKDSVWIPGYHKWNGTVYVWVPGRWDKKPNRHSTYVAGRWRHQKDGYVFEEGHWK